MCRLQFSDAVSTQPLAHEPAQYDADDCVEALLALAANNEMDFDAADLTAEPLSTFKGFPQHQQVHSVQADSKDSTRYHCPYPGCKRSFQELWRLKVHFRAPPNIRGSGKERGHGMRLTHCPKCGAALKVGGHHVKCAAVPKEPASAGNGGSRRNRKAATTPRAEPMDPAMAAAMYTEPSYQQSQTAPTAGTAAVAAAAAGASSKRSPAAYMQYGLSDMLQQETSNGQSLWQKALQLHAQQQQQQLAEEYEPEHNAPYNAPLATSAKASNASLQRLASSDDSSSSRMVEATCSGGSGSGNDANYAPSSSSGYGSGSEDMDNQQQQPLLSLFGSQAAPAAAAAAAAAAGDFAVPVKQEQVVMPAVPEQQQQHPEAGQLLWQHMLLQHLQQHVQQTPGFSLPELIQVASALFGNKVDTLVSAFGLSGSGTVQCQEQAQLSQLVAALRQPETETATAAAAAAEPAAAAAGYAAYASIIGAGGQ